MYFRFLALLLIFFSACTPHQREVRPSPIQDHDLEVVTILGTNDIHGALVPISLKSHETGGVQPIEYEAAGAPMLGAYIRSLRGQYGSRLLWLDAGDEFQGTIESNLEQGAPVVSFFNLMGLQAAAVGNHEFDFGVGSLEKRMSEAHYPYLAANIAEKKTGAIPPYPGLAPHKIFQVGNLKVGVFGLSTLFTPTTTRAENVKDLNFTPLKDAVLRESQALRNEGAQIVVLTAHVGLMCSRGRVSSVSIVRKPTDPQGECTKNDEMVELLESLPSGTLDAVVSGHSHQIVHHWINNVPVIQGGVFGRYFNLIHLTYDHDSHQVIPDLARIEGPVPVCPLIFKNQNDCNGDRPAPHNGRGPLVHPNFHGKNIEPDQEVISLLQPVFKKSSDAKKKIVGQAASPIKHERKGESALGNFVVDAMKEASNADIALTNSGSIRADWEAGPITYEAVFRSLPFDNTIVILELSGKELKTLLSVAESGSRGFPPLSGVQIRLISPGSEAPAHDLNGDGRVEPWEINRLLSIKLSDGKSIDDSKHYRLATNNFLVSGGDDFAWPMSQIPKDRIHDTGILMREAVLKYLSHSGPLNSAENPLIDRAHPRIQFERTGKKVHRRKRRS